MDHKLFRHQLLVLIPVL